MIPARLLRSRPGQCLGLSGRRSVLTSHSGPRKAAIAQLRQVRFASNKRTADEVVEELTEQYATAKDEFDIAVEETEKVSMYAEDDRGAAREELDKLHGIYNNILNGTDKQLAEEVRSRVGQRIRELDNAVQNMEELAQNQD